MNVRDGNHEAASGGMGLRGKIFLVFGALLVLSLAVVGGVTYWQSAELASRKTLETNLEIISEAGNQVVASIGKVRSDLLKLKDTPPIRGIMRTRASGGIDPLDGSTQKLWQKRLAAIFKAFLLNVPEYAQIRYLDETGKEQVRVDSDGKSIRIVSQGELQDKSAHAYFRETIRLEAEKFYYSALNLNREHGRVEKPHRPMFRVALPVFNQAGQVRGMLIINVLGSRILDQAMPLLGHYSSYVVNRDGYFLRHPDASKTFGFDLGFDHRLEQEIPEIARRLRMENTGALIDEENDHLYTFLKIAFDAENPSRYWAVILQQNASVVFRDSVAAGKMMLWAGLLIGIIAILIILWLLNRIIVTPVMMLADATHKMKQGDLSVRLPVDQARDEFQMLYRTINEFAESQQESTRHLQREVTRRTAELESRNSELEMRGEYERSFGQVMALFSSGQNLSSILNGVLGILADVHPYPVSALYIYDHAEKVLNCAASFGATESLKYSFRPGEGLVGQAASEGKTLLVKEVDSESGAVIDGGLLSFEPAALIVCPIRHHEKVLGEFVLGVIVLAASRSLHEIDCASIERLCLQIGMAIETRQLSYASQTTETNEEPNNA